MVVWECESVGVWEGVEVGDNGWEWERVVGEGGREWDRVGDSGREWVK